ncbi:MAG: glycosyltransferase family 2 protein [Bacteroidales bacterium]|nr:glycosyltransferase family 2 protein [Bacteroidales bacterium]
MELSVILICHNSSNDIKPCLNSLMEACTSYDYEILAVDNGSTDNSASLLQPYGPHLRLIRNSSNLGVAKARNSALKEAKGDIIWILDIDTIVNKEALDKMYQCCLSNAEIGLCGCKLTDADGLVQDSCRKYPRLSYKCLNLLESRTSRLHYLKGLHTGLINHNAGQFYHQEMKGIFPFDVEYLIGACQMFRHSVLGKVGYLDESIFYGPEDADFCLRIHKAGLEVIYIPDKSIVHHYNRSTNKSLFSRLSFWHAKGLIHFWWKNRKYLKDLQG